MNRKPLVLLLVLAVGCATVHHGRDQEIRVVTDPAGASVQVRCGKPQAEVVTPATVRLPHRAEHCSLLLTLAGFSPETVVFESSPSPWVWANLAVPAVGGAIGATRQSDDAFLDFFLSALIGGMGFGIDALSGAMWQWEPASVERKLTPQ